MTSDINLTGQLLIAMPSMADLRFHQSVIFIASHSEGGAMGVIINKPIPELSLYDLLGQMSVAHSGKGRNLGIHFGGPVERTRGFVLHSDDYLAQAGTMEVSAGFSLSATQDVLQALADGKGPSQALIMLGHAGWGPGQLEGEISQNAWLTVTATPTLVFSSLDTDKWEQSLALLGVSPLTLSGDAGHA